MKVMLINPPFTQPTESKKRCLVPMGLLYIASFLRICEIDVNVLDCVVEDYNHDEIKDGKRTFGLSKQKIEERIREYNPTHIGVSCLMTTQRNNAYEVCRIAKDIDSSINTTVGGCHPSAMPNEALSHTEVDNAVIGEGEMATLDIIRGYKKGIVSSPVLKDLDAPYSPWPARDLVPFDKYIRINMPENIFSPNERVAQIVTSRGCPFQCSFCATRNFHGSWRGRSAKDVIDEINFLIREYNIDEANILDENFILNKQRAMQIMAGIHLSGISWSNPGGIWTQGLDDELLFAMKKARAYQLTLPIETSNERLLKEVIHKPLDMKKVPKIVKTCKHLNIDTHAFFVCGFPEQTREDMLVDYKFAKKMGFDSASFHILTPLPGSDLYERYKDFVDINNINYIHSTIPHPTMTKEEIESLANSFNNSFNKSLKWRHPAKYFKKYVLIAKKRNLDNVFRRV